METVKNLLWYSGVLGLEEVAASFLKTYREPHTTRLKSAP